MKDKVLVRNKLPRKRDRNLGEERLLVKKRRKLRRKRRMRRRLKRGRWGT